MVKVVLDPSEPLGVATEGLPTDVSPPTPPAPTLIVKVCPSSDPVIGIELVTTLPAPPPPALAQPYCDPPPPPPPITAISKVKSSTTVSIVRVPGLLNAVIPSLEFPSILAVSYTHLTLPTNREV